MHPPPLQLKTSKEAPPDLEAREVQPSNYLITTGASVSPNDNPSVPPNEEGTNKGKGQQKRLIDAFQGPVQKKVASKDKDKDQVAPFQLKPAKSQNGMADDLRSKMENAFQADFSNVNIHQNSQNAQNIGALAYTQGNDVHFAPGQFKPNTHAGQELIGHELTHVIQQRNGRVKPTTQAGGMLVNDDKNLEGEADNMGRKAAAFQLKKNDDSSTKFFAPARNNFSKNIQAKSATIQMKAAPGAKKGASGGNGQLNLGGTSNYLQSLGSSQPINFISKVKTAPSSLGQIYHQQQAQAQKSLPVVEQPTGLLSKASPSKEKGKQKDGKAAGKGKEAKNQRKGKGGQKGKETKKRGTLPSGKGRVETKAHPPASQAPSSGKRRGRRGGRGKKAPAPESIAPPANTSVKIGEESVSFSAGNRRKVDTSGEANPQQLQTEITKSGGDIQQEITKGNGEAAANFGENDIFPELEPEMMESKATIQAASMPAIEQLGEMPALEGEVVAGFNQQAKQHLDEQIAPKLAEHEAKKLETEAGAQTEWSTYNQSLESETARVKAEQEAQQNQAKTQVEAQRKQWKQENEAVKQKFERDAATEKANSKGQIDEKIASTNQEVESVYAKAENDAATKATEAEADAKAAEDDRSFWEKAWDWLKDRFNDIVNGLKAAVNAIINAAKSIANTIIDTARNAIVGMIQAFGNILKGLVDIAFAAFPEIRDRIKGAIDTVVNTATDLINSLAESLKNIVSGLLDVLGNAINALLSAYQAFVNAILDAIEFIAVGLYKIMQGINNLVKAARQSPSFFWGQLSEEILGMDVTKPLPNERPALVPGATAPLAATSAGSAGAGTDSAAEAFMNKSSYSEGDFMVQPVVSGEVLPPEIIAQLQKMGDRDYEFGESNDEGHSMEAFKQELLGHPTQETTAGTEMESAAPSTPTAAPAMDDGMVGPFASTGERLEHVLGQFKQGVADWWNKNQVKIIAALAVGLLGLILANIVTGGAVMAALPLLMQVVGAYFLGEAIVRMTSYFGSYLGSAWPGQIAAGATSLARGLAIGAFELVSSLLFGGKAAIRGMKNGVKTVARQGVRGAAKTGARSIKNSAQAGMRTLGEAGGMAKAGLKNTFQNGKAMIAGVGKGFSRGAKSIDDLGQRLAKKFKFRKFKFSIKGRKWSLLGKMNPWTLLASGHIKEHHGSRQEIGDTVFKKGDKTPRYIVGIVDEQSAAMKALKDLPLKERKALYQRLQGKSKDEVRAILMASRATADNAKKLRDALVASGKKAKPGEHAHHIVPSTHRGAEKARLILKKFNIDVNHGNNGVFLSQSLHSGLHTTAYINKVTLFLERAKDAQRAKEILKEIESQILKGTFI